MKKPYLFVIPLLFAFNVADAQERYEYHYDGWGNYQYRYEWQNPDPKAQADAIRERWKLEDEAEARREAKLKARREQAEAYRQAHPPKAPGKFIHKGKEYKNYAEFKQSDAYLEMLAEAEIRSLQHDIERKQAEDRRQAAVEFERNRRLYNTPMIFLQEDERQRALARKGMGDWWWKKHEHPELYDSESPSYKIADKIAKKHGITRQQAWSEHVEEVIEELDKLLPPGSYKTYEVLPRKK